MTHEEFHQLANKRYDELQSFNTINNFYDYEKEFEQSRIRHSQYVAHFGSSKTFTAYMDHLIESYGDMRKRLVFISDGGLWIKNWTEDAFPEAIAQDYYRVCEHLHVFADTVFKDKEVLKKWTDEQKELLLQSKGGDFQY